jgi:tetratricopeptide (TPR) repeat protein
MRLIDEIIDYDPFDVHARRQRGKWLFEATRYDEAIRDFEIVLQMCPRDDDALAKTGRAHLAMRRPTHARTALLRAVNLNPANHEALQGLLELAQ